MLTRAIKPNFEVLRDAAKQLLIWSRYRKAEFCTLVEDQDAFSSPRDKKRNEFKSYNEENEFGDYNRRGRYDSFNRQDRYDGFNRQDRYDGSFRRDRFSRRRRYNFVEDEEDFDRPFRQQRYGTLNLLKEDINFSDNLKEKVTDYYKPHPDVLNRSQDVIEEFRRKNDIKIFGTVKDLCPPPILNFSELDLPNPISKVISKLNYTTPTPSQSQTWPIVLSGYNMVGISRTGSGKTLGFVLPALIHISHQLPLEPQDGPIALMIAPTRELVQQIFQVIIPFAKSLNLRVATLYGGAGKNEQLRQLMKSPQICVATPGRLNDLLNQAFVNLRRCTYLVLDEADRLLDMGFHPQIKSIFHYCRPDRQVSMWSATWPEEVESLAEDFLKKYVAVKFGSAQLTVNPNITQHIHVCEESEKMDLLKNMLQEINETDDNKTLIFTSTKIKAEHISRLLYRQGFDCGVIHGDKSQKDRDKTIRDFRSGRKKILVGTEVVGRGLDIQDIRYVINYDFPNEIESYVHIIGRTARKENPGTSHSFFTDNDRAKARDLIKILHQSNQVVSPELQDMVQTQFSSRSRSGSGSGSRWRSGSGSGSRPRYF